MYSLEQVAEQLGLHVRTIRSYVRNGRLHAVRIGKQYRVSPAALAAMTGTASARVQAQRVEVSSVVQIDALSAETAARVGRLLPAAKASRDDDTPLRLEIIHHPEQAGMKIIAIGSLPATAELFKLLNVVLET